MKKMLASHGEGEMIWGKPSEGGGAKNVTEIFKFLARYSQHKIAKLKYETSACILPETSLGILVSDITLPWWGGGAFRKRVVHAILNVFYPIYCTSAYNIINIGLGLIIKIF